MAGLDDEKVLESLIEIHGPYDGDGGGDDGGLRMWSVREETCERIEDQLA